MKRESEAAIMKWEKIGHMSRGKERVPGESWHEAKHEESNEACIS